TLRQTRVFGLYPVWAVRLGDVAEMAFHGTRRPAKSGRRLQSIQEIGDVLLEGFVDSARRNRRTVSVCPPN
ncbi:hypothetical protein ACFLX9_04360, partial [Chloroflexota bacterium]